MLFAFLDDQTVDIIESEQQAYNNYESIDVENADVVFFDSHGRYLEPRFIQSSKQGKFLGLFSWGQPSTFELTARSDNEGLLLQKINATKAVNPNKWLKDVRALRAHLEENGVALTSLKNQ